MKRADSPSGPYETDRRGRRRRPYLHRHLRPRPGARYYYVVSAVNEHGESDNSNQAIAMAVADDAGVPAQVQNLVAVMDPNPHGQHVNGEGRVDLSWNHVAGAESYVVRRGTTPGQYTNEFVTRDEHLRQRRPAATGHHVLLPGGGAEPARAGCGVGRGQRDSGAGQPRPGRDQVRSVAAADRPAGVRAARDRRATARSR